MKTAIIFLFTLTIHAAATAQDTPSTKTSFGFQLNQYQKDFGIGLNVTSPYFVKEILAVRGRVNMMFYEHIKGTEITWTPYTNITLGLIGLSGNIRNHLKMYGEGGLLVMFPSGEFSGNSAEFGGYGFFGFEVFIDNTNSYFIELGGSGTGAVADKLPFKPIYSNGFITSVGYKHYFN